MKKSILQLAAIILMLTPTILSCTNPPKKAQENITERNKNIIEANQEYLDDIQHYKEKKAIKIESNSQSITDFKAKIDAKKKSANMIIDSLFSNWNCKTVI